LTRWEFAVWATSRISLNLAFRSCTVGWQNLTTDLAMAIPT